MRCPSHTEDLDILNALSFELISTESVLCGTGTSATKKSASGASEVPDALYHKRGSLNN